MADIRAGTKLNVVVDTDNRDEGEITLTSSLEGFGDNNRVLITAPTRGTVLYPLPLGKRITVWYYDKSAIISFDADIRQRISRNGLEYMLLERIGEFRRKQRRQDFRMDCLLDGRMEYTDETGASKRTRVVIVDVSGGGAAIRSPVGFPLGETVTVSLPIGEKLAFMKFISEVRRCIELEDDELAMKYNVGLQFHFRANSEKEALVSRIFIMERENRKKYGGKE